MKASSVIFDVNFLLFVTFFSPKTVTLFRLARTAIRHGWSLLDVDQDIVGFQASM
jgi:hypothetical protein